MLYEIIESHGQPLLYQAILYTIMVLYIDGTNSSTQTQRDIKNPTRQLTVLSRLQPRPADQHALLKRVKNFTRRIDLTNKVSHRQPTFYYDIQHTMSDSGINTMIQYSYIQREATSPAPRLLASGLHTGCMATYIDTI